MAVLQIDFAENFTCLAQDEVQSAYYNRTQITLFTSYLWFRDISRGIVAASDTRNHTKTEIVAFLSSIIQEFVDETQGIRKLSIWSDGPTSQFRNRFTLKTIEFLQSEFNIKIEWNFQCPGHGKGAVDGIGGSVKRSVHDAVKARQFLVHDLNSFVTAHRTFGSKITMLSLTEQEIELFTRQNNLETLFSDAPSVVGIRSASWISWNRSAKCVDLRQLSSENLCHEIFIENIPRDEESQTNETQRSHVDVGGRARHGDFVVVPYDGLWYLGVVDGTTVCDQVETVHVSCLAPAGPSKEFWWPAGVDKAEYPPNEMICRLLQPPMPDAKRRQLRFKILEEVFAEICSVAEQHFQTFYRPQ